AALHGGELALGRRDAGGDVAELPFEVGHPRRQVLEAAGQPLGALARGIGRAAERVDTVRQRALRCPYALERLVELDVGLMERDVELAILPPEKGHARRREQREREGDAGGELRPYGTRLARDRRGQGGVGPVGQRFFGHGPWRGWLRRIVSAAESTCQPSRDPRGGQPMPRRRFSSPSCRRLTGSVSPARSLSA